MLVQALQFIVGGLAVALVAARVEPEIFETGSGIEGERSGISRRRAVAPISIRWIKRQVLGNGRPSRRS
jgi:hypothetical protein